MTTAQASDDDGTSVTLASAERPWRLTHDGTATGEGDGGARDDEEFYALLLAAAGDGQA